jgi:D-3-phosphoglycerate dehydrogenase
VGVTPVVVVAASSFGDQERLVAHFAGAAELRFREISTPEMVAAATADADGIVVALQPLRRAHIEAFSPGLKVIGRAGVGVDSIDLEAAASMGVAVVNEPSYGATEVASHGVAMMLALQRNLLRADRYVRDGWSGDAGLGTIRPVDELTVGLVGCGRIGSVTACMLRGIVAEVLAYDPLAPAVPDGVIRVDSLEELLARSDVVSLHMPLTDETRGVINAKTIAAMRPGAILVNVSRGPLVDETALAEALESGQIGGAALDVFEVEPLPADSPLLAAPNTVFSPHMASNSVRAIWRLATWTIGDTVEWITARRVSNGGIVIAGTR